MLRCCVAVRLQITFEQGKIQTPQLLSDIELPSNVSFMGQSLDLSQVKQALQPVNEGLKGLIETVGGLVSQAPDLQFPIENNSASTWLLTTYLDDDTRITRGDGGSVFVLSRDVSPSP